MGGIGLVLIATSVSSSSASLSLSWGHLILVVHGVLLVVLLSIHLLLHQLQELLRGFLLPPLLLKFDLIREHPLLKSDHRVELVAQVIVLDSLLNVGLIVHHYIANGFDVPSVLLVLYVHGVHVQHLAYL